MPRGLAGWNRRHGGGDRPGSGRRGRGFGPGRRWPSPTEGVEALALNTFAQEELARAGAAYMEIAGIYDAVDGANASVLS